MKKTILFLLVFSTCITVVTPTYIHATSSSNSLADTLATTSTADATKFSIKLVAFLLMGYAAVKIFKKASGLLGYTFVGLLAYSILHYHENVYQAWQSGSFQPLAMPLEQIGKQITAVTYRMSDFSKGIYADIAERI